MRIAVCNSRDWFELDHHIAARNKVANFKSGDQLTLSALQEFAPDLVFFPHWNWIVEEEIFSTFTCIVFHTAPLPFGRGGSPIQNLIRLGFRSSPVCAIKMTSGIDEGPIYATESVSLEGPLTAIFERLNTSVNMLIGSLIDCLPEPTPQAGEVMSFRRLTREDNLISLDASLADFYEAIRMVDAPDYPSAFISLDNVEIEFSEVKNEGGSLSCMAKIVPRAESK